MPFNPAPPINLQYKKNRNAVSSESTLTPANGWPLASAITIQNIPNWLTVSLENIDGESRTYKFLVKTSFANNLSPGIHSQEIQFKYKADFGPGLVDVTERVAVNLTVIDTIKLSVSPSVLNFVYTVGGQAPPLNFLNVTTENSWTIVKDQSWITLNKTSGTGNGTVEVGADVTGLAVGNYQGLIQINDGYDQKTVNVNLQVKGADTANDFLLIEPNSVQATINEGDAVEITKSFLVKSSEDFTIASDSAWLVPDDASLTAGTRTVTFDIENTSGLTVGTYIGNLTITSNFSTVVGQVVLIVNEAIVDGVESNGFYYADDRDEIKLNSLIPDSELLLDYQTTVENEVFLYQKRAPFFKGVGKSLVGSEAKNLVKTRNFSTIIKTGVYRAIDVLNMRIDAYDKIKNSTEKTLRQTFTNVKVIPGATPSVPNRLSYIPGTINVVPNGIVAFSFKVSTPPTSIAISGSIIENIAVTGLTGDVFVCMVNLSQYSLVAGDVINVGCGGFIVKAQIVALEPEAIPVVFLNEWHCPEIFTCYGHLESTEEREQELTSFHSEGLEVTRVIESKRPEGHRLNTGWIYSDEEAKWLAKILRSPKTWLWSDGKFQEVICTNDRLRVYKTREYFKSYLLTFKNAQK